MEDRYTAVLEQVMNLTEPDQMEIYIHLRKKFEKGKSNFGDPQINEVIGYLKSKLNLMFLDGTVKQNRSYAKHVLTKIGGSLDDPRKAIGVIKLIIDNAAQDQYWRSSLTSVKALYYNLQKLSQLGTTGQSVKSMEQTVYSEITDEERKKNLEYLAKLKADFNKSMT